MPLFENRRLCLCRNSLLRDRILWDAGGLPAILLRSRSCAAPTAAASGSQVGGAGSLAITRQPCCSCIMT
ncbi:hypothetical protein NDU88_004723 [Pleurodeles waltl]|uniref:Uncharacterized protein n=1 Tax=Pleurodeles waltl TaxID=8319 RepID=A0AAV7MUA6_PLEWA|nr:hypothetical protein NDU88_004723 [Pleurodeles waltl]